MPPRKLQSRLRTILLCFGAVPDHPSTRGVHPDGGGARSGDRDSQNHIHSQKTFLPAEVASARRQAWAVLEALCAIVLLWCFAADPVFAPLNGILKTAAARKMRSQAVLETLCAIVILWCFAADPVFAPLNGILKTAAARKMRSQAVLEFTKV